MPHGNNGSGHGGFMGLFNPVPISEVIDFFFFLLWEGSCEGRGLGLLPLPPAGLQRFRWWV